MSGRTPKVLVDTLPWLLYVLGDTSLDSAWKEQIDQCSKHSKLFLSAASVAECAAFIKQEKLVLHQQSDKWLGQAILQSKTQKINSLIIAVLVSPLLFLYQHFHV